MAKTRKWIGFGLALVAVAAVAAWSRGAEEPERPEAYYFDRNQGIGLEPPELGSPASGTHMVAAFSGPPKRGFASNVNVQVQHVKANREAYREISLKQFKDMGLEVLVDEDRKVQGLDAVYWEYKGTMQGRDLHWVSLAVIRKGDVVLVTGTAPAGRWETDGPKLEASIESLKLLKQ